MHQSFGNIVLEALVIQYSLFVSFFVYMIDLRLFMLFSQVFIFLYLQSIFTPRQCYKMIHLSNQGYIKVSTKLISSPRKYFPYIQLYIELKVFSDNLLYYQMSQIFIVLALLKRSIMLLTCRLINSLILNLFIGSFGIRLLPVVNFSAMQQQTNQLQQIILSPSIKIGTQASDNIFFPNALAYVSLKNTYFSPKLTCRKVAFRSFSRATIKAL